MRKSGEVILHPGGACEPCASAGSDRSPRISAGAESGVGREGSRQSGVLQVILIRMHAGLGTQVYAVATKIVFAEL